MRRDLPELFLLQDIITSVVPKEGVAVYRLTDVQVQKVIDFLSEKWGQTSKCWACGHSDWGVSSSVWVATEFVPGGVSMGTEFVLPFISVTCEHCGLIVPVNAISCGILPTSIDEMMKAAAEETAK